MPKLPAQGTGVEELRDAVRLFDMIREDFARPAEGPARTAEELLLIYRAHMASGWTYTPEQWTPRQVREALSGYPPKWDDSSGVPKPIYRSGK